MSKWSDIAYRAALTNPDIVVTDDSTMSAVPREGHYNVYKPSRTIDALDFITGLMRENSNELGFIPNTTIESRYIAQNRYILQTNDRGRFVGYLLHGSLQPGKPCVISQAVIDYDYRARHWGTCVIQEFISRCLFIGVSSIHLRVASDMEAVFFWKSLGFVFLRLHSGTCDQSSAICAFRYG